MLRRLIALMLAVLAEPAMAEAVWTGPVAQTPSSQIFAPVVLPGSVEERAMNAASYIQEEWFLSGDANIYGEKADGGIFVRTAGTPYTTRLVIVRPKDPKRFNGVVQLGFNHPHMAGGNWARIDGLVLRTGMAYAMLLIGGDPPSRKLSTLQWPVSTALLPKWYDPQRYASFRWGDDDGIRWDVIGQAASLLHDPGSTGPLAGLKVERIEASGWSFLGSTIRSWINFGFHDRYRRPDGSPVIDGYLIGISAASVPQGHTPLNSTDPAVDRTRLRLRTIDRPVIELTSETEAITNVYPQVEEIDTVRGGHRLYELGGVEHMDGGIPDVGRPATQQLQARGHPFASTGIACSVADTDVPMRDVAQAAIANLDRWIATGVAPPKGARLMVSSDGKAYTRDRFGNAMGGIRAAQLDVPLVRYVSPSPDLCGGKVPVRILKRIPLDPAQLNFAYPGGKTQYLTRFQARLAELVKERWLLAPDAAVQLRRAQRYAAEAFPAGRRSKPAAAQGRTPAGAQWRAEVPANWNGTLLLFGRGYSPKLIEPAVAPGLWKDTLLSKGYALAASDYGSAGWALAEAVPAQRAAAEGFARAYGKPARTIAWGQSMGGLVTTALAEDPRGRIDGALAICPSIGGAIGMMNMGLDAAFAFATLVAPGAGLKLVGVQDDMANGRKAQEALSAAMKAPEGRARVALAGVLGGAPGWTRRDQPRPEPADYDRQVEEIAATFVMGTFMPRQDQEARSGGIFSWNEGIDYAGQLALSGRRQMVEALYRKAGLDLDADLARLAAAPRISADPRAVAYMTAHYTPNGKPKVPIVSLQAVGDGATSPSLQRAYVDVATPAMVRTLWLDQAGHCIQSVEQVLTALAMLERRLDEGEWSNSPAATLDHTPPPMLRPCVRGGRCR